MIRTRLLLLMIGIVGVMSLGFWVYRGIVASEEYADTPVVTFASPAPQAALSLLLAAGEGEQRSVIACTHGQCQSQEPPSSLGTEAVFDGESWYYYQEALSDTSKLVKRILQRAFVAQGNTEHIIEDTPLTSPRELLMSPDGKYLAFFLDNIDQPEAALTELWYYHAEKGGTRVLIEKLFRPDILTTVRWNRSSNILWFLADSGTEREAEDKVELITASVNPPAVAARFANMPWRELKGVVDHGVMDIAPRGTTVAYVRPTLLRSEELVVGHEQQLERLSVRGHVVHLQWLEDDNLLYTVQDQRGFTFWRMQDSVSRFLARRPGQLLTAHGDVRGEYVAFAVQEQTSVQQLYSLHIASGAVANIGTLTGTPKPLRLVHVGVQPDEEAPTVAGETTELDDAQLAAFIAHYFSAISGTSGVKPTRLLMTGTPNTLYVDYQRPGQAEERILITVNDTAHADWSIKGRYVAQQAEWQKVQGGGLPDPKVVRLYEWEESVGKWILKTSNQ